MNEFTNQNKVKEQLEYQAELMLKTNHWVEDALIEKRKEEVVNDSEQDLIILVNKNVDEKKVTPAIDVAMKSIMDWLHNGVNPE